MSPSPSAPATPITRWQASTLPDGYAVFAEEARTTGHEFIDRLAEAWAARPFLDEGEGLFVAQDDGQLAATAAISADPVLTDGATGRLRFVYVREAFRGRGLAEALVRACLARAGRRWRRIELHTGNPVAARLYLRNGFVPLAEPGRSTHRLDFG